MKITVEPTLWNSALELLAEAERRALNSIPSESGLPANSQSLGWLQATARLRDSILESDSQGDSE